MKAVDQDQLHDPPDSIGNCLRACVASVLEVGIDEVDIPDFEQIIWDGEDWFNPLIKWAESKGYAVWYWYNSHSNGPQISVEGIEDMHVIATGPSPRFDDASHCVVYLDGQMVHDPHPSRDGLSKPPYDFIAFVPLQED